MALLLYHGRIRAVGGRGGDGVLRASDPLGETCLAPAPTGPRENQGAVTAARQRNLNQNTHLTKPALGVAARGRLLVSAGQLRVHSYVKDSFKFSQTLFWRFGFLCVSIDRIPLQTSI